MKRKLNKDELILTCFSVCHAISNLFLGTFVISFLMHNSINEIVSVSMYRLFYYFAIFVTFILSANWCKCGNKKTLFGMNIVTRIVLLGLIAVLGTSASDYVIILGILYGIFDGFYNLPTHNMTIEKVDAERMVFFLGTKAAIKNTFKMLVPVTLGILISTKSLQNIAWVIMILAVTEILLLIILSPSVHREKEPAKIITFYKTIKNIPIIRKLLFAEIFRGFANILETVVTMYIVYVFHTDINLGIWTTVFALCTIAASWAFGRFCSRHDYKWVMGTCSLLMMCSAVALFINVNMFSALFYAFASNICIEITNQICSANVLNMTRIKSISDSHRTEFLIIRDSALFIGRWIAFVSLLYIGVFGLNNILRLFVLILVCAHIFGSVLNSSLTESITTYNKNNK